MNQNQHFIVGEIENVTHHFTNGLLHPPYAYYAVRNRFYQPQIGLWITRDPIGEDGGLNLYRAYFVPRSTDPFGLEDPFRIDPALLPRPGGPGRNCAACHPVQPWVRSRQPTLPELMEQATPDIQRVVNLCQDDRGCERAIGTLFQHIPDTPSQSRLNPYVGNKCFKWGRDFLQRHYPDYSRDSHPPVISLQGGRVLIEPLDIGTRGGEMLTTTRTAFGYAVHELTGIDQNIVVGRMNAHCVFRVTIKPQNGQDATVYFDLGSSTHLGNYGGDDHFFFPNTPGLGFEVEMDIENARPFYPEDPIE